MTGVEALVVPANKQLTLGWGSHLAEAVLARAGAEVEAEALAQRPDGVELGDVLLTGPGRLETFGHLLHAAVLDKYDMNPLFLLRLRERTSGETLERATTGCLALADREGIGSLVFTPMGAGIGGMRDRRCAEVMADALRRFERGPRRGALTRVVFACWKERTAACFRKVLDEGTGP